MKACIFDMDGTLLDSMPAWRSVSGDFLRDRGLAVPKDMAQALPTMSSKVTAVRFAERFPQLGMTAEDILAAYMRRLHRAYVTQIGEKPGASAYLRHLRAKGIPYCVATTTDRTIAEDALRHAGMLQGCAFVLSTKEMGLSKADPACFVQVAQRLGVSPEDCVVFEDALYAIEGACKAGFTVVAVQDAASAQDAQRIARLASRVISDYAQLL